MLGEISVTSLVLVTVCQFHIKSLVMVLIDMIFGVCFQVMLFMASLYLGAMTFRIRLFV